MEPLHRKSSNVQVHLKNVEARAIREQPRDVRAKSSYGIRREPGARHDDRIDANPLS